MTLPNVCCSMQVGRLRYIQSLHESGARRNPDALVGRFIPVRERIRLAWARPKNLMELRKDPFYDYLIARTKYYDEVFQNSVMDGVGKVASVGCGSDTRAHRFRKLLRTRGVRVLECDQPEVIRAKQRATRHWWFTSHVEFMAIDLNDDDWPQLESWMGEPNGPRTMVLMEGVCPYVNRRTFRRFLGMLGRRLPAGSRVCYDFKIQGVQDDFGRGGRTEEPFRLPAVREEIADFHADLGLRLERVEWSAELCGRVLPEAGIPGASRFSEDGLAQLRVG